MSVVSLSLDTCNDIVSADTRDRIIESHRYLCRRAAAKFVRRGLERADLEQVATIGLIKAADRYDGSHDTPFDAYAWRLVLGELMHFVRDSERIIRAPRRVRDLHRAYGVVERVLTVQLGRTPSEAEILAEIGASDADRRDLHAYRQSGSVASLDSLPRWELGFDSYALDGEVDRIALHREVSRLSPLEREIVVALYECDMPMNDLARKLGYSRRHVSRLHNGAIKKLLAWLRPADGK